MRASKKLVGALALGCLLCGAVHLGLLNLWAAPRLFAPEPPPSPPPPAAPAVAVAPPSQAEPEPPPPPKMTPRQHGDRSPLSAGSQMPAETPPTQRAPRRIVLHFATSDATLSSRARETLVRALAAGLKRGARILIEGHADRRGSVAFNRTLSWQRAREVAAFLAAHGIDAGRLTLRGRGHAAPLVARDAPAAWAKNRRVEIRLVE